MTGDRRLWLVAAAAAAAGLAMPALAQSVQSGVEAWQAGNHAEAVRQWRPLAERGDADALFNLGHAYRLGRGVPQDMARAEQHYERAARAGHVEAQAMYGLILFQNGRRQEAMPYVRQAAERGDARAQYVYGTALFNGDVVTRDWPRAYAFISRAAASGLPYAESQLREMDQHLSAQDRTRGLELAQAMESGAPTRVASAAPPLIRTPPTPAPPRPRPPRVTGTPVPPSTAAGDPATTPQPAVRPATPQPRPPAARPARPAPAPAAARPSAPVASLATAGGRWRVQLGAFSNDANARRAWSLVSRRLPGLQPFYVRAGAVIRLQAGPLASRADAGRACTAARQACFPVAP